MYRDGLLAAAVLAKLGRKDACFALTEPFFDPQVSFDSRAFRHALSCYSIGVAVVTAGAGKAPIGITVNSFASLSQDPPLVPWCMDRKSSRYRTFTTVKNFTTGILGSAPAGKDRAPDGISPPH
jgi:hypothetical protein